MLALEFGRALVLILELTAIPSVSATAPPVARVYGGAATAPCAWPSAVLVALPMGTCSGTLIAPDIVVYAAHCGAVVSSIVFGDDVRLNASRVVQPERCAVYPGHDPLNGTDFAYCKLKTPIDDLPIVPVLMGCETAVLKEGKQVVLVGFGEDEDNVVGVKRQVVATQHRITSNKAFIGGDGKDTCFGDSGGPAFVQLTDSDGLPGKADNSWRVYGITSYTPSATCGPGGYNSLIFLAVPWIEADSGVDVTPCHDADGTWAPDARCDQFPLQPSDSTGTWDKACVQADRSGPGATCGPPFNSAPAVSFAAPNDDDTPAPDGTFIVVVDAQAGGGDVNLTVSYDGTSLPALTGNAPPLYRFGPARAAPGSHLLVATLTDASGYTSARSLEVNVTGDQHIMLPATQAGCAALHASSELAALLPLLLFLRRKRFGSGTAALVAFMALTGCGGPTRAPPQTNVDIDVTDDGVKTRFPGNQTTPTLPDTPDAWSGTVAGFGFSVKSSFFFYGVGRSDDAPALYVVLSDQPNFCELWQTNSDIANSAMVIVSIEQGGYLADAPTSGTYPVTAGAPPDGPYANLLFQRSDAQCVAVSDADAMGQTGDVKIETYLTKDGARIVGTLTDVAVGAQMDKVSGTFTAKSCDLSAADPDAPVLCKPAP